MRYHRHDRLEATLDFGRRAYRGSWTPDRVWQESLRLAEFNPDARESTKGVLASQARQLAHPDVRPYIDDIIRHVQRFGLKTRFSHQIMKVVKVVKDDGIAALARWRP